MATPPTRPKRRVLAIASGGGHWVQLRRMRAAWAHCETVWVTTRAGFRDEVMADGVPGPVRFYTVPDANRWQKLRLVRQALAVARILLAERPDVVVTTGAAPGAVAIWFGRLTGARTVWIDSIANAEELSLSGARAGPHADLWLTQWPHLARERGPQYRGAVL